MPEPVRLRLGAAVRAARTARGWSQARLAAEAGVSRAYVEKIEKGRTPDPGIAELEAIALCLGFTSVQFLLDAARAAGADAAPPHLIRDATARYHWEQGVVEGLDLLRREVEQLRRDVARAQYPQYQRPAPPGPGTDRTVPGLPRTGR